MWNDPYLKWLNPHLVNDLPPKPITIVYQTDASSPVTALFTDVLSRRVPEWRDRMGNSTTYLGYFPAMDSGRTKGGSLSGNAMFNLLVNEPYSFGFYHNLDVVTSRTLKAAKVYNDAGNVVACNTTTINSAMQDVKDDITPAITLSTCSH
jgi:hypothetical protein